ncbi:MAG: hypothetical protein B6D55_08415 [Candidatus Omnitrophica bacterium 4484_70.2]|nr:MAG: hypothetical protein B6D55_08415 [Candidatus Omnitrophica bacterium 4484_70.2]
MGKRRIFILLVIIGLLFLYGKGWCEDEELKKKSIRLAYYGDRLHSYTNTFLIDERITERINQIGQRLANVAGREDMEFVFKVINRPQVNAFTVGGGFIFVYTGLLDVLQSEEELAAVLAHEMAHSVNDHPLKYAYIQYKNAETAKFVGEMVSLVAYGFLLAAAMPSPTTTPSGTVVYPAPDPWIVQGLGQLSGIVGGVAANIIYNTSVNGYSRNQEFEADAKAVEYLKKAGYDPQALVRLLKRLKNFEQEGKLDRPIYALHIWKGGKNLEARIKKLEELYAK